MSSIRPLRRLLRVLILEEEQVQAAMESALRHLHQIEAALHSAVEREHLGRQFFGMSAHSGDAVDRLAALQEIAAAQRSALALQPQRAQAEREVDELREEFLARRIERRQVETLLRESEARETAELARRSQQSTDDWFLGQHMQRIHPEGEASSKKPEKEKRGTT